MLRAAIIGTVAVAIAGFIAVRLIGGGQIGGGSPLAEAGDGLDGQSVRMRLEDDINLSGNDHRRSTSDVVTVPDGSRGRVTLTVDSPRLDTLPQEHVFIGHEVWWRSERIASDLPRGKEASTGCSATARSASPSRRGSGATVSPPASASTSIRTVRASR
jgi:hypothetical protein